MRTSTRFERLRQLGELMGHREVPGMPRTCGRCERTFLCDIPRHQFNQGNAAVTRIKTELGGTFAQALSRAEHLTRRAVLDATGTVDEAWWRP